jgi:hypothetical protein
MVRVQCEWQQIVVKGSMAHLFFARYQNTENEMSEKCNMREREKNFTQSFSRNSWKVEII